MGKIIQYREKGKVWIVQVDDFAPAGFEKLAKEKLKQRAKYELYEKPKVLERRNKILKARDKLDKTFKELMWAAEAVLGQYSQLPSAESYVRIAASEESIYEFPIFSGLEKDLCSKLRKELPQDKIKEYQIASKELYKLSAPKKVKD